MNSPGDLFANAGSLLISEIGGHRIRGVDLSTNIIETVAGEGSATINPWSYFRSYGYGRFQGDGGPATLASLHEPNSVCVSSNGDIYIADSANHRVRVVLQESGIIQTILGASDKFVQNPTSPPVAIMLGGSSPDNTPANRALLNYSKSVALTPDGDLLFSDSRNNRILLIKKVENLFVRARTRDTTADSSMVIE